MQDNKEKSSDQNEFSFHPVTIVQDVLKHWYLIVIVAVLVGMAAYVISDQMYVPSYTTTTTFVVSAKGSSTTVYQNLTATSNLATVFSEVLNSSLLRKTVLETLNLSSFDGTISASAIDQTNLLILKVTSSNPRTAFLVTKAIIENHQIVSYQVLGDTILEVLQNPKVPTAPSNPNNAFSTMKKASVLTAAAMCLLLAMLSYSRNTVRSKQEAQNKLDCYVLGEIRHEKKYKTLLAWLHKRKRGILITKPSTSFLYAETIRKLRRRVEQRMPQGGKVLMVVSLLENEGKSTVAVNLALSMAQKDKKVLVIDCDLRKPACHKILGYSRVASGTMNVVTGKSELADSVVQIKGSNLYALLQNGGVHSSADVAGSKGMASLIQQARDNFDYVILDTPPMSIAPDVESLMEFVDASLLVVRQNEATATSLNHVIEALQRANSELLGCVINNVYHFSAAGGSGYGYGYGYGYGHYGKYGGYGSAKKSD